MIVTIIIFVILFVYLNFRNGDSGKVEINIPANNNISEVKENPKKDTVSKINVASAQTIEKTSDVKLVNNISVLIGDDSFDINFIPDQSLYEIISAPSDNVLSIAGKNYSGLGFYVTNIGNLYSGNGKNLMYSINGKEASVGVSSYIPKDGDVIVWELK